MVILLGLPGFGARLAASAGALGLGAMVVLFLGTAFGDPIHSVLFFTVVPALTASPTGRELFAGPPPGLMDPVQMAGYFTILAGPLRQPRSFPQIAAALAGWSAMAYGLTRRPTSASAGGLRQSAEGRISQRNPDKTQPPQSGWQVEARSQPQYPPPR